MSIHFEYNVVVALKPEDVVLHQPNGGAVMLNILAVPPVKVAVDGDGGNGNLPADS